jgi:hypothetical protein
MAGGVKRTGMTAAARGVLHSQPAHSFCSSAREYQAPVWEAIRTRRSGNYLPSRHQRPSQHHERQLAAVEVLLVFEALIGCDHHRESMRFSGVQELAVNQAIPPLFRRCSDFVSGEIRPKLIRDVFIKQNAQAVGFRRTALRPSQGTVQFDMRLQGAIPVPTYCPSIGYLARITTSLLSPYDFFMG